MRPTVGIANRAPQGHHVPLTRPAAAPPPTPEPVLRRERAQYASAIKGHRDMAARYRGQAAVAGSEGKGKKGDAPSEESVRMAEAHEAVAAELEAEAAALK